jgi:hypothetical protein
MANIVVSPNINTLLQSADYAAARTNLELGSTDDVIHATLDVIHTAAATDDHALEIDADAAGFGDVKAVDIVYITGAMRYCNRAG